MRSKHFERPFSIRLPPKQKEALAQYAAEEGISEVEVIRAALREYFDKRLKNSVKPTN